MSEMTLEDLSKRMGEMDFAMLLTRTDNGEISGRPMSNNGDVEYDGDSFFFTYEQTRTVKDITREPKVGLSFAGDRGLFGKPPLFIAIAGHAELIRDKAMFEKHWNTDLERWFENGIDTPGMVLIKIHAERLRYWDGEDGGEVPLD